ncbi:MULTISPECIES: hypothetical protein [Salinivibrio]|uniref:Uncharacterized protein n=1 Tax=Salinivibrio siamensis TaxID=414286 RepID=A0ABX3KFP5_9GAMM|nr:MULTISPECIES: hypothetical protein [Salinivibrio]KKA45334.1 hypothetical protein WN56_05080 [Salinivibrio sp. KP-1]OOE76401.1 hypothetical protein BZG23_02850 [Salinivibrio sp. ML290]OOE87890.1 hypothetical protein BZG73_01050 [Salinivibrio siamensis]
MNTLLEMTKTVFGYICFVPFLFLYSGLLSLTLAPLLLVGGVGFLCVILGIEEGVKPLWRQLWKDGKDVASARPRSAQ